jgi:hypothetical protein
MLSVGWPGWLLWNMPEYQKTIRVDPGATLKEAYFQTLIVQNYH